MLIAQILSKHDIAFVQEYKLPNIHYKFRYDFYLPDYRLLIEFHGIQHYHPVGYFGGQDALTQTRFRDQVKERLAKAMNINTLYLNYRHLEELSVQEFEDRLIVSLNKHKNFGKVS